METIKFYFYYLAVTAAHFALIWYGFVEDMEGARNVFTFLAWLGFLLSWFAYSDALRDKLRKDRAEGKPEVAPWLSIACRFSMVLALVWFGALWTAAAMTFAIFNFLVERARAAEPQEGAAA